MLVERGSESALLINRALIDNNKLESHMKYLSMVSYPRLLANGLIDLAFSLDFPPFCRSLYDVARRLGESEGDQPKHTSFM